jgi:hypothetical protein
MTTQHDRQAIVVTDVPVPGGGQRLSVVLDGVALATADIGSEDDAVILHFEIRARHLPPGARQALVEAVFDIVERDRPRTVEAAIPLGDVDLLTALAAHLALVHTHAAGSTCLIDATTAEE